MTVTRTTAAFVVGPEGHDRLTGVHRAADPHASGRPVGIEGVDVLEHGDPASHGALGIVAVSERRAEDRHGGVADELLDDATEPLDPGSECLEEQLQTLADVFGVALLGMGRGIDDVDEQNRNKLAFLRHRVSLRHRRVALYRVRGLALLASFRWSRGSG